MLSPPNPKTWRKTADFGCHAKGSSHPLAAQYAWTYSGVIPEHWRTARCSRFLGAELGEGKEEEPEYGDPCGRYRSGEHAANPVLVVKQRQGARLCYSDA